MTKLQAIARQYLTPALLVLLAGAFLVVLGELVLYRHWEGAQFVGFAATIIGTVAVLLGLFAKGGLRIALAILLALLSISGLIGTVEHLENAGEGGEAARPALAQASAAGTNYTVAYRPSGTDVRAVPQDDDEEEEEGGAGERGEGREAGEEMPPPLAPLSLAGLSLMGAIILLAKQD